MKKNSLMFTCLFMSHICAQDLPQRLQALTSSLNNLKDTLSGKSSRILPKTPEQIAQDIILQPVTPTRDSYKDKSGKPVHGWYGFIKDGQDKGKLGIYVRQPSTGSLMIDGFFDANGQLIYSWDQGTNYELFPLYDPNGPATQNASAKKLYEKLVSKGTGSSGGLEIATETSFEDGLKTGTYMIDGVNKKLQSGLVKGTDQKKFGFYVPTVMADTKVEDFFATKDEGAIKKGDLIYPASKRDKSKTELQMVVLYDADKPSSNDNAKFLYQQRFNDYDVAKGMKKKFGPGGQ